MVRIVVCSGRHDKLVCGYQFIIGFSGQFLFQLPKQEGSQKRHAQVSSHLDKSGRKILEYGAGHHLMRGKEIGEPDDEHHRRILDVDDVVVADLGHDIPKCLRQDNIEHRLPVVHADGFCAFELARVDAHDAAAYRLCHIRACVDRYDKDTDRPYTRKVNVKEVRKTVEDKDGLEDHGRSAEKLDVRADDNTDNPKEYPFDH